MRTSTARALQLQHKEPLLPSEVHPDEVPEQAEHLLFTHADADLHPPTHPHNACVDTLEEMLDPCGADKEPTSGIKKKLKEVGRVFCLCCCLFKSGQAAYRYKEAEKPWNEYKNGPGRQTM